MAKGQLAKKFKASSQRKSKKPPKKVFERRPFVEWWKRGGGSSLSKKNSARDPTSHASLSFTLRGRSLVSTLLGTGRGTGAARPDTTSAVGGGAEW